jgi:hypothetical protein
LVATAGPGMSHDGRTHAVKLRPGRREETGWLEGVSLV